MTLGIEPGRGGDLQALEQFVVENDELLTLESLIGRFNIFDALGVANAEIRHSNFLSFLLDPAESHGQSQLFLRALLMDLLKAAPRQLRPLSPIEVDGTDLRGVTVRREWKNIDLLITCKEPAFVVVVENKIGTGEHSNQLARYQETISRDYPAVRPLYVFLTPDGVSASSGEWIQYSYASLHGVLSRVRKTNANAIGDDVLVFLDHYLNLIGTRFMNDKTIDDLCKQIYKKHRQALNLIYERAGSPAAGTLGEVESILGADDRWFVFYTTAGYIDFVPYAWLPNLPPVGLDYKEDQRSWFVLRFEVYQGKLLFYAQVNRIEDLARRREVISLLLACFERAGLKRRQEREVSDKWTRLMKQDCLLEWGDDDPDLGDVRQRVRAKLDDIYIRLEGVPSVLREAFPTAKVSP